MKDKANYCLQCKNSPCRNGCPLGNNIPLFIRLFREDNNIEAYNTLLETTCLPSICGRICPHEVQCQSKCIRGLKGDPVSIGEIESTIGDIASAVLMIVGCLITFIVFVIAELMMQMGICHMAFNEGAFSKAFALGELKEVIDEIGWFECIITYVGLIIITLVISFVVTSIIGISIFKL